MLKPLKKRQTPDYVLLQVELRTDAALVLRNLAAEKRVRLEDLVSDILLDAAKKQAFENLKEPAVNR